MHRAVGMLVRRLVHRKVADVEQFAHRIHITERHPGLPHAPWSRVHSQEDGVTPES